MQCGVGDYTYCLSEQLQTYKELSLSIITSPYEPLRALAGVNIIPQVRRWNIRSIAFLVKFLQKNPVDILHLQYPTQAYKDKIAINFLPFFLKQYRLDVPFVVTLHDVATAHPLNKLRLLPFLLSARKVILTVDEEKKYIARRLPQLASKLCVVNLGSNIKPSVAGFQERVAVRAALGLGAEELLLTHFGYLLRKKKLEILFYALKHLLDEGYKIKLLLISAFSPEKDTYHKSLQAVVGKLKLDNNVIWAGYCAEEKASGYLLCSDINVQIYPDGVSFRRGSLLAALGHGLAIVGAKAKALPDGLREGEHIVTFSPQDLRGLIGAIKMLASSPALRKNLGENAFTLSQRFSWAQTAEKHFDIYQGILKNQ